jgi:hypothetical protein
MSDVVNRPDAGEGISPIDPLGEDEGLLDEPETTVDVDVDIDQHAAEPEPTEEDDE